MNKLSAEIKAKMSEQPIWLSAVLLFCAFMTFIYIPWDLLFKPVAEDQEVWFGLMLTGWAAKATEPLHWLIYATLGYGIWQRKAWLIPALALYIGQVAIGMLVWNVVEGSGSSGLVAGLVSSLPFLLLAVVVWRYDFKRLSQAPGQIVE